MEVKIEDFVVMGRGFSGSFPTYEQAKACVDLHGEGKVYVEADTLLAVARAANVVSEECQIVCKYNEDRYALEKALQAAKQNPQLKAEIEKRVEG